MGQAEDDAVSVADVVAWLGDMATEETRDGMSRYGIPNDRAFGVPMGKMKRYAKRIGTDQDRARELWKTGWYEARTVAALTADPALLTPDVMDSWAADFDNWAICDTTCFSLFDRTAHAWGRVDAWAGAEGEFARRAAFALLWGLTVHDKGAADDAFVDRLPVIEQAAADGRDYVRKGVNMALRAIGKRNRALNTAAIDTAERLAARDQASARWVGTHALRELRSDKVQSRFR